MAKSKARFLSELLGSTGLVKKSKSALAGADEVLDLDTLPTIPNSKLANATISIAGHSTALGGSVSLNTGNISEHTDYKYYTDVRARAAVSVSGDLAYNSSTGVFSFTERTDAEVRGLVSATGSLSYNSSTGVMSFTMPAQNTSNITEGSNLYFTNARADARIAAASTSDLSEGSNLYFTNARARSAISATGSLSYNSTTGVMSFTMPAQNTSNITEGTNLYYTNARADARIAAASTSDLSEGTNLYYTDARADARVALIVDSSPAALNTLNELAAALGDDANFSTTVNASIAAKAPLANPAFTGALIAPQIKVGDGTDGVFYSDQAGRTAFNSGDFYIQTGVTNYYNYATNQYHGNSSGDNHLFRGNPLSGNNWSITAAGVITATGGNSTQWNTAYTVANAALPKAGGSITPSGWSAPPTHAALNIGYNGSGQTRAIDIDGAWQASESKAITFTHGTEATNILGQWDVQHNSPGSRMRWGKLYHSGDSSTYTMELVSTSLTAADLYVNGSKVIHLGNDGASSGLNADLLDGLHAVSFLRSDATDTAAGSIDLRGGGNHLGNHEFASSSTGTGYATAAIELRESNYTATSSATAPRIGFHWGGVVASNIGMDSSGTIEILDNPGTGYEEIRAANFYVGSGTTAVWHPGNDGPNSGLDADTVDGVHASGFGRFYNNAVLSASNTTANFIAELIADYGCFNNNQVTLKVQWSYAGSSDLVTGHATIGTLELAGCTIETWGGTYKHVRITRPNTGAGGHMVVEYNDQSSSYQPGWREIWTSESDGASSGLDADLLDGQHGSYYTNPTTLPNGSNLNASYGVTAAAGNGLKFWNGSDDYKISMGNSAEYHYGPVTDYSIKTAIDSNASTRGFTWGVTGSTPVAAVNTGNGNMQIAGTFASAGATFTSQVNVDYGSPKFIVGSTSNLDLSDANRPNITLNGGMYPHMTIDARIDGSGNASTNATHGPVFSFLSRLGTSGYRRWGIATAAYNAGALSFGYYDNSSNPHYSSGGNAGYTGTGSKMWLATTGYLSTTAQGILWGATNDGPNSGLDADTVDGVHVADIQQLGATQTVAGVKYYNANRNTTSNNPPLQAYGTSSGAIMSFHRGGYYAVNMGLDSDNVFRIGGWSAANNRFVMDMSGNLTMAGNITAYSDSRLKENVEVIGNALSKVQAMRGVTFTRNDVDYKEERHAGVIAQEVEVVFPEVVSENNEGIKNVAYGNMVGLLIEAIKELKDEVDELKRQLKEK